MSALQIQPPAPEIPVVDESASADEVGAISGNVFAGLMPHDIHSKNAANDPVALLDERLARIGLDAQRATPGQVDRAVMRLMIGPRMQAAREIAGYTQTQAAEKFGYQNSTQLSLWEMGKRMIPLEYIHRAASIYGVSLDYIFCLSDDPERHAGAARRNACTRAVQSHLAQIADGIATMIDGADNLAGPNAQHFRELLAASQELTEAIAKFHRLNVSLFENARGGATVLAAAERLGKLQLKCARVLAKHDEEAQAMAARLSAIRPTPQEG